MEIDKSMFGHKRKYNRGRVSEGAWVFGMVERVSGRALTFCVPGRTRETLVTRLVQEFIQPRTVILSDKFSPYFNLPYFFTYKPISAISRDPESQGLSTRLRLPKKKSKTIGYKPRVKLLIVTGHLSKRASQKT